MTESRISGVMWDERGPGCSRTAVDKTGMGMIGALRDCVSGIIDRAEPKDAAPYKLLTHYNEDGCTYREFLQLTGKICMKMPGKYFGRHINNRMAADRRA